MGKLKISMTIDECVFNDFKDFCAKNGMKISTKVEVMMKQSMKDTSIKSFI